MRRFYLQPILFLLLAALPAWPFTNSPQNSGQKQPDQSQPDHSQDGQSQPDKPQQQPDSKSQDGKSGDSGESSSSSSAPGAADELKQAETAPKYDPFPSEQDVEVGTFYLHKGDTDAAISRFEDAIRLRSNYAKPRLLLAQIYEKKKENSTALKYYKEYLEVYPHAPDAKKVQEKIAHLSAR